MATARSNRRAATAPQTKRARAGAPTLPGYWMLLAGVYGALALMFLLTEIIRAALGPWPTAALVMWLLAGVMVFAGMVFVLDWWQERQR